MEQGRMWPMAELSRRKLRIQRCNERVAYETEGAAMAAMKSQHAAGKLKFYLTVYRCWHCDKWHLKRKGGKHV